MRCFVAVELSDEIKRNIYKAQDDLKQSGTDAKWVRDENLHITMRFLGEIEESTANQLSELFSEVYLPPFQVALKGIGTFPESKKNIRVVWVGCGAPLQSQHHQVPHNVGRHPAPSQATSLPLRDKSDKLVELYRFIEGCTKRLELPPDDKGFTGHATIARTKSPKNIDQLAAKIPKWKDHLFGIQKVDKFTLFKSELTPQGPIYTPVSITLLKQS